MKISKHLSKLKNNVTLYFPFTLLIYIICLTRNVISYYTLIKDYWSRETLQDAVSYYEILENGKAYGPDISTVIIRSIYLALFLSLVVWFAAYIKGNRFICHHLFRSEIFAVVAIVIIELTWLSVATSLAGLFAIHVAVLTGIAATLLYIGYAGNKGKIVLIAYIVLIVLISTEKIVFNTVIPLTVPDTALYVVLSFLDTYKTDRSSICL